MKRLIASRAGATSIEYGLLAALVAMALIIVTHELSKPLQAKTAPPARAEPSTSNHPPIVQAV